MCLRKQFYKLPFTAISVLHEHLIIFLFFCCVPCIVFQTLAISTNCVLASSPARYKCSMLFMLVQYWIVFRYVARFLHFLRCSSIFIFKITCNKIPYFSLRSTCSGLEIYLHLIISC